MFYLTPLQEEAGNKVLSLSATTICLCLTALIPAQERENWIEDLEALSDAEWDEAEDYLTQAINELTGQEATLEPIIGEIRLWPSNVLTQQGSGNWIICDGRSLDKNDYPELFLVIGYNFGGSGDDFNIPDLRGRFPVGAGGGGLSLADQGGVQSHNHDYKFSSYSSADKANEQLVGYSGTQTWMRSVALGGSDEFNPLVNDGTGQTNNMPPYLALNFIIYSGSG
jgi:microcystin-dependent protein